MSHKTETLLQKNIYSVTEMWNIKLKLNYVTRQYSTAAEWNEAALLSRVS